MDTEKQKTVLVEYYYDKIRALPFPHRDALYSPLFDKSVSKLSDTELRLQVELWIQTSLDEVYNIKGEKNE